MLSGDYPYVSTQLSIFAGNLFLMYRKAFCWIILWTVCISSYAQDSIAKKKPLIDVGLGRGFTIGTPDSNFSFSVSGRIQTLIESKFDLEHNENTVDFAIRRARLNLGGSVWKGRFSYRVALCFSPRDVFADNIDEPNTLFLRDAMIYYHPNRYLMIGVGMTKLPGNRQRVNSSGKLQLVERSNANNMFTLDRDKGIWLHTFIPLGKAYMKNILSVSTGEGRVNAPITKGLCYTFRTEILPMGKFQNDGDYFESDLAREPLPKLSIGALYSFNHQTSREAGQLGDYFFGGQLADIHYFGGDFIFKWKGFSMVGQYYVRKAVNGISIDSNDITQSRYSYSGQAILFQTGYLFTKKDEIAARYSVTLPDREITQFTGKLHEIVLGYSHFFFDHNLKIQTDLTWFTGPGRNQLIHRLSGVIIF